MPIRPFLPVSGVTTVSRVWWWWRQLVSDARNQSSAVCFSRWVKSRKIIMWTFLFTFTNNNDDKTNETKLICCWSLFYFLCFNFLIHNKTNAVQIHFLTFFDIIRSFCFASGIKWPSETTFSCFCATFTPIGFVRLNDDVIKKSKKLFRFFHSISFIIFGGVFLFSRRFSCWRLTWFHFVHRPNKENNRHKNIIFFY